jgi:CoA:oxalate CoA-transferase
MGRFHNLICPAGVFKGPQGWIFILVLDRQWSNMAKAIGSPEVNDARFATGADRVKNRDEVNAIVQEWLLSFKDDESALAALDKHRIPSAPVLSVADTIKHPYFKAREMVRTVQDPILGEVTIPGFPLKFSAYPDLPDIQAPLLGQHGAQVLKEVLEYSEADIEQLRRSGTLHSENK